ncbi:MAG TPA: Ppx/GppA phosphatase family protein [Bacteroidota bacterium]|nr:Ppx/GppA phosphatase family protein [Bacteroidota bacterium]
MKQTARPAGRRDVHGEGDPHQRLAAIDVGTNSFHMVVAAVDPQTGGYTVLAREKERVRLGEGSGDMKFLSAAAMDRGIAALRRFRTVADRFEAPVTAVATSAVREAVNKDLFIRRIAHETGIRLDIVSGLEEARLAYLGALQALPVLNREILLVDLGGGSTEFLIGKKRKVLYDNSLKIGAIRMTERFFPGGVTSPKSLKEARGFIRGILSPVRRDIRRHDVDLVVGTSGTIVNLANIVRCRSGSMPLGSYNAYSMSADDLLESVELVLETKRPSDRLAIEGLDPSRSDIITGGAVIIEQVVKELGLPALTVSEYALREGILRDVAEQTIFHKGTPGLHDIRLSSVRHLAKKLHYEKEHCEHVAALALGIFDQASALHGGGAYEREMLEAAAILHEVGLFISHERHHQHSYYLIRNAELLGFREDEKEVIANIARYHRKSHPKMKHESYSRMPEGSRNIVRTLAAILRIADGLDRTHRSVVTGVKVAVAGKKVKIRPGVKKGMNAELEIWGANQKKGLFEEEFDRTVEIPV